MKLAVFSTFLSAALLTQFSVAHPGQSAEEQAQEIAERRAYLANNKRSLAHCADALKARGNDVAMHARRSAAVERLRVKRAIAQGKFVVTAIFKYELEAEGHNRKAIYPCPRS